MITPLESTDLSTSSQDLRNLALNGIALRSPEELAKIVSDYASSPDWLERVRLRADQRWYERLHLGRDHDVWLLSWMPGQATGYHDHGDSAGAFIVLTGFLEEHKPGTQPESLEAGAIRAFGSAYTHDVRNVSAAPAISIHAYSPPLTEMNEFELDDERLVPKSRAGQGARGNSETLDTPEAGYGAARRSIEELLLTARSRLRRLSPEEAFTAVSTEGAVLVDIRPVHQRTIEGSIPGALVVERNVLEWRFDPKCVARLPIATGYDLPVIVFCSEGYTSSLAAGALQDLGLWRATDVIGGFQAWQAKGLSAVRHADPSPCFSSPTVPQPQEIS